MAFEFISAALDSRRQQNLLRQTSVIESSSGAMIEVDGQHYLNFSSNDYLGQRQQLPVMQAWVEGIAKYGVGSGASPLVTGHTRADQALQDYLAEQLNREKVMLFSSGFAANQAICQSLSGGRKSNNSQLSVIADKLMHASFIDAAMHSEVKFSRFSHNDMAHLSSRLADANENCLIATEGVFSMDGDSAPLVEISNMAAQSQAWLMVDDAHGMGVLGKHGLGSAEALNLSQQQAPVLMGTFGKAIGTAGAFVAGSADLIDYMTNFAKHFIYSTALPPALSHATLASFQSLRDGQQQQKLRENIALFKSLFVQSKCNEYEVCLLASESAIQPLIVGEPASCLAMSNRLKQLGIWISAIRYPTVPKGLDRLRITLSASHTRSDIHALIDALEIAIGGARQ